MRNIIFSEGEYYHLYNRGVDKRVVFSRTPDYKRFLAYLYILNSTESVRPTDILEKNNFDRAMTQRRGEQLVSIGAYCLMPNHFHLYVTPRIDDGISRFMQKVSTAYTMYFNKKYERSGALFQGTFKAQHVHRDVHAR